MSNKPIFTQRQINYLTRYPANYNPSFIVHSSVIAEILDHEIEAGNMTAKETQKRYSQILDDSEDLGDGLYRIKGVKK